VRFQREFLRLAAQMLRCRYQLVNGRNCTKTSWVQYFGKPIDHILCYVGYADHKGEMDLLCQEVMQ
jgi:hypothetical protein